MSSIKYTRRWVKQQGRYYERESNHKSVDVISTAYICPVLRRVFWLLPWKTYLNFTLQKAWRKSVNRTVLAIFVFFSQLFIIVCFRKHLETIQTLCEFSTPPQMYSEAAMQILPQEARCTSSGGAPTSSGPTVGPLQHRQSRKANKTNC